MCVYLWVYLYMHAGANGGQEGVMSPGAGLAGD